MAHMKASLCGEDFESASPAQAEQMLSLLERRGIVEDPDIPNEKRRR